MYLKALELDGFKSFSEHTIIDFTRGITAIVGPNGSGKSNILDAILWVLGEQSYKNIRAKESSDVIFSGGKNKRASSQASVSLIIENTDRYLDYESDEVKITRRIFKNGDGEYFINNRKARLKDIHNLFMDTGIGKQAYSIIGQGRVERIISSNPREIREILEEAAGTKRAKIEKEEALKKLSNVKIELDKIEYVEKELYQRVKRLKDESEKASLFKSLSHQINVKNYMIYEYNFEKISKLQDELIEKKELLEKEVKNIEEILEKENIKSKDLIQNRTNLIFNLDNLKEKISNIYLILDEKRKKLSEIEMEKSNFEVKLSEKLQIKDKLVISKNEIDEKLLEYNKEINFVFKDKEKKERDKKELEEKISSLTMKRQEYENKINEREKSISEIELSKYRINLQNDEIKRKLKTVSSSIKTFETEKKELNFEKEKLIVELEKIKLLEKEQEKINNDIFTKNKEIYDKISKLELERKNIVQDRNNLVYKLEQKKINKNLIEQMIEENQLLNNSAKYILDKYSKDNNILNTVSNLIEIDNKYLQAISTLASFNMNDIVIKNADKAKIYIEDLKKEKIGSISFLPLDSIKVSSVITTLPTFDGVIDFARNLVKTNLDINLDKLILHIFSNSLVVKDMDVATKIMRSNFPDRIITIEGDIISNRGRIVGGYKKNKIDNILMKKEELKKVSNELLSFEENLKIIDEEYNKNSEEITKYNNLINESQMLDLKNKISRIKEKIEVKNNEISGINRKISTLEYEIKDSNNIIISMKDNLEKNEKTIEENHEILENIFEEKENLEIELGKLENTEKYQKKLNTISIDYAVLNEKLTNLKNNKEALEREVFKLNKDLEDIYKFENNKEELFETFNKNIEKYLGEILSLESERDIKSKDIKESEVKLKEIETLENDNLVYRNNLEKDIIKLSNNIEKISENIGRNYKELENIEEKIESLNEEKENILTDYYYFKLIDDNVSEVKKEISELESKKTNIGGVNLSSIDEYNEENDRYEKINSQKKDLEKSLNSIYDLINNIEKEMVEKFTNALNEIKNNFKYMCFEIFYGAKGDIRLIDEEDILNSGLELRVKYKNKPEQSLMLLSGGEKSMLAVSFIMAIFMFKPSPFTFFDEIEAALDEANTKKIVELLRRFIDKSQFILITHNKETMKGADRLYGVTMNKEIGESRIVSVDM